MKARKVSKKLALNKRTVVNFDGDSRINLKNLKGGETYPCPTYTCITCNTLLTPAGGSLCLACYGDSEAPDCTVSGAPTC
jgi:hypothetical protein